MSGDPTTPHDRSAAMSDRWDDLPLLEDEDGAPYPDLIQRAMRAIFDEAVTDLLAERDRLAAEVERLRAVIDCCPFDDTPLMHDDANPRLAWWCETCGHITERPSALTEEN